jgi:serine-type D-Ala-D-Ala carboxypeptidase (penicillin-binding protein 5/6)
MSQLMPKRKIMETDEQKTQISKALLVLNAVIILAVVFMFFLIYSVVNKPPAKIVSLIASPVASKAFDNVNLIGKSAYVFDVANHKVIYKKNEFVQLPLASITKLMTALTALELLPKDSHITIKKEFLQEEGDTGLLDGESWRLSNLLDFSLLVSSNDGARSVASVIGAFDLKTTDYDLGRKDFIAQMNTEAERIGLKETYFINESGLDEGNISGGYGSAIDVAKLMQYILTNKPEIVEDTKYPSVDIKSLSKIHTAKNTNTDIGAIPGLLASKTGYTELAGGNLVVAFDASIGKPIIIVVLGSTESGRFQDVSSLVKASLAYVSE